MIFLPLEIKSRELDSRVMLACSIAQNGGVVYLGREDIIDFLAVRTKGGIFYSKIAKTDLLKLLKKNNKKIVWLDEEAGILVSDKLFFEYRLTQTASNLIDILCFWTKQQRSYYLENFKSKNKKTLFTGSVRQDLLLNLKKERKSQKNYKQKKIVYTSNASLTLDEKYKLCSDLEKLYCAFENNISKIKIRKHPWESIEDWQKIIMEFQYLELELVDFGIVETMRTADIVIHNGSSVSIDAALTGLKSIKYIPIYIKSTHMTGGRDRGDKVCKIVTTFEELISVVSDAEKKLINIDQSKKLSELGFSMKADATGKITDAIMSLNSGDLCEISKLSFYRLIFISIFSSPINTIKLLIRNSMIAKYYYNWYEPISQCDVISVEDIQKSMALYSKKYSHNIKINKIARNLFCITNKLK